VTEALPEKRRWRAEKIGEEEKSRREFKAARGGNRRCFFYSPLPHHVEE
jgi:hypothetical protein